MQTPKNRNKQIRMAGISLPLLIRRRHFILLFGWTLGARNDYRRPGSWMKGNERFSGKK